MSVKVFKERWVNYVNPQKDGSGLFVYLSGDDQGDKAGFIIPTAKTEGVVKGAKVTVKARKNGKNWDVTALRVDAAPSAGSGGGRKGGYGGGAGRKADPAVQQSIVMQHSQTAAIALLGKGADLGDVLKTAVVLFAQAYGPGLEAAVERAADLEGTEDLNDADDNFGEETGSGEESDEDNDFSDDFDD